MSVRHFLSRISLWLLVGLVSAAFIPSGAKGAEMHDFKTAKLRSLDKITARTKTFEVNVGQTVRFGDIYIQAKACREPPPIVERESAAFLQVWELDRHEESRWVFSGWMFASSPALSSMDHPIYDVWLLDCIDRIDNGEGNAEDEQPAGDKAAENSADEGQSGQP